MALDKLGMDTISRAMLASKQLLETLSPILNQLDVVYNEAGGLKGSITDADLAAVPTYSGLTKQELDDGMYALTSTVKSALATTYNQLTELAARG
jgi:hypothetical protein